MTTLPSVTSRIAPRRMSVPVIVARSKLGQGGAMAAANDVITGVDVVSGVLAPDSGSLPAATSIPSR